MTVRAGGRSAGLSLEHVTLTFVEQTIDLRSGIGVCNDVSGVGVVCPELVGVDSLSCQGGVA